MPGNSPTRLLPREPGPNRARSSALLRPFRQHLTHLRTGRRARGLDQPAPGEASQTTASRAWARSATRSSAASIPTESRTSDRIDLERRALGRRVRHPRRMLDQRLDRAERLGEREQPRPRRRRRARRPRRRQRGTTPCRRSRASGGARHRGRGGRRARDRARGRPRRARAASRTIALRVRAVPVHAHRERLHPAQHEVAVERRRHRAHRVLQEPHLVGELGVVRPRRSRRRRRSDRRGTSCSSAPTTSAPSASGCCRYGVANVLSTTTRAPAGVRERRRPPRCRRSTARDSSAISIHTSRVSSRQAASSAAGSRRSTAVHAMPVPLVHAGDEPERAAVRVGRG